MTDREIHRIYIEQVNGSMYHMSYRDQVLGVYTNPLPQIAEELIKHGETGILQLWDRERSYYRAQIDLDALRAKLFAKTLDKQNAEDTDVRA